MGLREISQIPENAGTQAFSSSLKAPSTYVVALSQFKNPLKFKNMMLNIV